MDNVTIGTVFENEGDAAPFSRNTYASVAVTNVGTRLDVVGYSWSSIDLTPQKTRELGFLLIKAAERHEELIRQVRIIDEQRRNLDAQQNSLIQELLK